MKDKADSEQSRSKKRQNKHFDPVIMLAWCKSCGICSAFCPKHVIGNNEIGIPVIEHPDDCIGCRFCELHCPDFAIAIKERCESDKRLGS